MTAAVRTKNGLSAGWRLVLLLAAWFVAAPALALPVVSALNPPDTALGEQLALRAETGPKWTPEQALHDFTARAMLRNGSAMVSFGLGQPPMWFAFAVDNPTEAPLTRLLLLSEAWLDEVEIHIVDPGGRLRSWRTGDRTVGAPGLDESLGYVAQHDFVPGRSTVLIRLATDESMMLNLRLRTPKGAQVEAKWKQYGYGFLYGFLLALIAYNLMLFAGLRRPVHLWYAAYLLTFIALNVAYTGRGMAWLWGAWPAFQHRVIEWLMIALACTGFGLARSLLALAERTPQLDGWLRRTQLALPLVMAGTVALPWGAASVYAAFIAYLGFVVAMVMIGVYAFRERFPAAQYFLFGALASVLGGGVMLFVVWGLLPANLMTYHGIEIAMMVDAVLLARAVTHFVRMQVDERVRAEREARLDPLTHLLNRRGLFELADSAVRVAQRHDRPLAVIMVDVDHFKRVNDNYGHGVGDQVLIEIAQFLSWAARRADVVARWGGEEFVLLLPETGLHEAATLAERLRTILQELSIECGAVRLHITASFGVSQLRGTETLEQVVARADGALYRAKEQGRDRVEMAA